MRHYDVDDISEPITTVWYILCYTACGHHPYYYISVSLRPDSQLVRYVSCRTIPGNYTVTTNNRIGLKVEL